MMKTIHLRCRIDPTKVSDFEHYGRLWIELAKRAGGRHCAYFVQGEGDTDEAFTLFSFGSLAA